jgi:hypothetical protein
MAARAGAAHVTTVEVDEALARVAKKVVAANGFKSKITCVHNKSTSLRVPEDMSQKANIVVSEILGTGLLDEGVRPSICDALARLATSDAVFIPSGAKLMAQLVESEEFRDQAGVNETLGFDMSALTYLQAPLYRTRDVRQARYRALSRPIQLTKFDFSRCEQPGIDRFPVKASAGGRIDAVVFWYELILDEDISISTGVDSGTAHVGAWGQAVKFLDETVHVKIAELGDIVVVHSNGGLDVRYASRRARL